MVYPSAVTFPRSALGLWPMAVTPGRAQQDLEVLWVHRIKPHRSHIPQEIQKTDCSVILISLVLIKFFSQWNLSKQLLLLVL